MKLFEIERQAEGEIEKVKQEIAELHARLEAAQERKFFWMDVQATAKRARELEAAAEKVAATTMA